MASPRCDIALLEDPDRLGKAYESSTSIPALAEQDRCVDGATAPGRGAEILTNL